MAVVQQDRILEQDARRTHEREHERSEDRELQASNAAMRRAVASGIAGSPALGATRILSLQRLGGNAAVGELLGAHARRNPVAQRLVTSLSSGQAHPLKVQRSFLDFLKRIGRGIKGLFGGGKKTDTKPGGPPPTTTGPGAPRRTPDPGNGNPPGYGTYTTSGPSTDVEYANVPSGTPGYGAYTTSPGLQSPEYGEYSYTDGSSSEEKSDYYTYTDSTVPLGTGGPSLGESLGGSGSLKGQAPYSRLLKRGEHYKDEDTLGMGELPGIVSSAKTHLQRDPQGLAAEGITDLRTYMMVKFGWEASDVAKYLPGDTLKLGEAKVKYLKADERSSYELTGGNPFHQGKEQGPFSTEGMFSKHSGADFGIYVMDSGGHMYADRHKVGLFHHSSFLAGGDVATAGELKVSSSGQLQHLTSKTGHYRAGLDELWQGVEEMRRRGISLGSFVVSSFNKSELDGESAQTFWDRKKPQNFQIPVGSGGPPGVPGVLGGEEDEESYYNNDEPAVDMGYDPDSLPPGNGQGPEHAPEPLVYNNDVYYNDAPPSGSGAPESSSSGPLSYYTRSSGSEQGGPGPGPGAQPPIPYYTYGERSEQRGYENRFEQPKQDAKPEGPAINEVSYSSGQEQDEQEQEQEEG